MSPTEYSQPIQQLLYADETGQVVGLDEVQLLDPIPVERIPRLTALLQGNELYLSYQAGLILAAWGVREGVDYLHYLVIRRIDKVATFEPHRLWDEDNVYDVIADALGIAILSGYEQEKILVVMRAILKLYGDCYFESKLKRVLLKLNAALLLPDIKEAMQAALEQKRYYQASQLLPVLAQYDKPYAVRQLTLFKALLSQDERINYNIAETQTYL